MKPFRKWPIIRTLMGKNGTGKKLHQVLPFKGAREVLGSVVRGAADLSPIPNAKDASTREKLEKVYQLTKVVQLSKVQGRAEDVMLQINDLLDDGQLNDSAELSPEARKKIRLFTSFTFFGGIAYEVIATLTGAPSVLNYFQFLIGL